MRRAVACMLLTVLGTVAASAQQPSAPGDAAQQHPAFHLDLGPILLPGYEPARELQIALWDSSMSRLELAVARSQWAARHPGPMGMILPFERVQLPLRLNLVSGAQSMLLGPWSPEWQELSWQDRLAAGMQTGLFMWVLVEAARHAR